MNLSSTRPKPADGEGAVRIQFLPGYLSPIVDRNLQRDSGAIRPYAQRPTSDTFHIARYL